MANTKQILRADWEAYFAGLTERFFADDAPETATVEVLSPRMGDQIEAQAARLLGIAYDPESRALEIGLEGLDHLAFEPEEIWVMEDEEGFVSAMEIKRSDGEMEILYLHRSGPLARRYEEPAPGPRG